MTIGRVTLALAVAAIASPATGDLRAQELTLPPAPSSATEQGGRAFRAESGPCFYNPYRWMVSGWLNQTLIAAEMQDLAGGWGTGVAGCQDHYALSAHDFLGNWSYMIADGVARPERVSQERVKAVWDASREAAAAAEAKERLGHVWVPTIGGGHGSDEALVGRTLVFRVAPEPTPATYHGIPIVERNRSWERFETTDGRRVWREVPRQGNSYRNPPGIGSRDGSNASSRSTMADRRIQREEGMRPAPRRLPTLRGTSSASTGSTSGRSSSASNASTGTKAQTLRVSKTRKQ